ncbi:MAG: TlpA family protein disulfide reductase [Paraprevotella sp.]|nr:TlpA family protein disulfide reductase [Paraprevotella sp.]
MKTLRKTSWAWLLLVALCCASGAAARKSKTFSRPAWVGTTTSVIRITEVEFTDTATILSFHVQHKPGWWILIVKDSWLLGDDNRTYKALRGEGIVLGEQYVTPPSGEGEFKVLFEPMPRKTRFFDFIEGNLHGAFRIYGVHEEGHAPKVPKGDGDTFVMTPELERLFFTADTACVKGRIEGYSRSQGYSTMLFNRRETTTGECTPVTVDIREDGTFECRFLAIHPKEGSLLIQGKDFYQHLNFYVVPGQTTEMLVKKDWNVVYTSSPSGPFGRSRSLEHGISELCEYSYCEFAADAASLDFKGFIDNAMQKMHRRLQALDYVAWRFGYTPWERHWAACYTRLQHGRGIFEYEMERRFSASEEDKASYRDPANYQFMREMPCNDASALAVNVLEVFMNRYEYAPVMRSKPWQVIMPDSVAEDDAYMMAMDTAIMGADEPSLFGRMAILRDLSSNLTRDYNDMPSTCDSIYQNRMAYMNREVLRVQAGRLLEQARRRSSLTYALPDTEGGRLLRSLTEKYRGKYVLIDFWGLSCGPCRYGIEHSKAMREALRNHPDVDFLFVCAEGDGSEEDYRKYVDEHLAGEDVVRVSCDDFNRLMELFNFLGIPHYETLDREGNVVRNGLRYGPEEDFLHQLERLERQLKE